VIVLYTSKQKVKYKYGFPRSGYLGRWHDDTTEIVRPAEWVKIYVTGNEQNFSKLRRDQAVEVSGTIDKISIGGRKIPPKHFEVEITSDGAEIRKLAVEEAQKAIDREVQEPQEAEEFRLEEPVRSNLAELGYKEPQVEFRTWTDNTGEYEVDAAFVSFAFGKVKLRNRAGGVITVPMERLSKEDQEWIRKRGRE